MEASQAQKIRHINQSLEKEIPPGSKFLVIFCQPFTFLYISRPTKKVPFANFTDICKMLMDYFAV